MDFRKDQSCIDLGGRWRFAYSDDRGDYASVSSLLGAGLEALPCTVPGNFELDLQANGIIEEPFHGMNIAGLTRYEKSHVWYFTQFEASPRPGFDAELVFEGIDCFADIYLNGRLLSSTDNMLVEHAFAVDSLLAGSNELLVHIRPAIEEARRYDYPRGVHAFEHTYESLYVRKAPHMYGWDIMPRALSAGIWRPVKLHYRPIERIDWVHLDTLSISPDWAGLDLHYRCRTCPSPDDTYEVRIEGKCGDAAFSHTAPLLFDAGRTQFGAHKPKLWSPDEPHLYDVTVSLLKKGEEIDRVAFRHGIRTVELDRTSVTDQFGSGEFCFKINGRKVFAKGTNWVPADAYHSRDAERIPRILEMVKDTGCNIVRCWGGSVYENDAFFDFCDENGIMVWQDFAMACAIYPQDEDFQARLRDEARKVVRRLRQHASLVLWSGDNECDCAYGWGGGSLDPNQNVLTRRVLPEVLRENDPLRPYLPSSPYIDPEAMCVGGAYISENHLWGPRNYYKSDYYKTSLCHFASEIGYHGCPAPDSIRKFISPGKVWPYQGNEEWVLHCTSPVPRAHGFDYRVELMANQVREVFGEIPNNLDDFAFASQFVQAEAKKFFIELFRGSKWRRTGIIWWNLMDGWPQFSDAVVDYYFEKKLAYYTIRRSQQPLCLMLKEPDDWRQPLVACNDTREAVELDYKLTDIDTGEALAQGHAIATADSVTELARVPHFASAHCFYLIEWTVDGERSANHYLAGAPPFDIGQCREWLMKSGLYDGMDLWWMRREECADAR